MATFHWLHGDYLLFIIITHLSHELNFCVAGICRCLADDIFRPCQRVHRIITDKRSFCNNEIEMRPIKLSSLYTMVKDNDVSLQFE